ncbi:MAG TPA: GxxExxY protein [Burkholderiales bacterium]|nr:GxxExxY protein [Burkholderiales bacterium]
MEPNLIARAVIDAAMAVHSELGPGLLESAYESCLAYELASRKIFVQRQVTVPVRYRNHTLDVGYRIDLLVDAQLIVEIKAVERIAPIHVAQVLTYLKLAKRPLGLLLNFNMPHLRDGIRRVVNGLSAD